MANIEQHGKCITTMYNMFEYVTCGSNMELNNLFSLSLHDTMFSVRPISISKHQCTYMYM